MRAEEAAGLLEELERAFGYGEVLEEGRKRMRAEWKRAHLLGMLEQDSASAQSKWELCLALLEMQQAPLVDPI